MPRFWQRVTEGLAMDQLWQQFRSEAHASYQLYRKEMDRGAGVESDEGFRRGLRVARELFWTVLMKLSPARRILLLLALVFSFLGAFHFKFQRASFSADMRGWAILLLLLLLAFELADRVTMKRDLEIAREIQRWLVPESPPQIPGVEIAFSTRPANTVAGDYYDAFFRDAEQKRLLLVVADVAGKSVPAALLMATFQACLHACARECDGPLPLAERLNQFACTRSLDGRRFTTSFLAELDHEGRSLHYVNSGHNPPVLLRAAGSAERLEPGGLPFGIDPAAKYEPGIARIGPGDLLFVFTDGLVEALNPSDEPYGDERMLEALDFLRGQSAAATIRGLTESVDRFSAGARQYDDITCLAVRLEPGAGSVPAPPQAAPLGQA